MRRHKVKTSRPKGKLKNRGRRRNEPVRRSKREKRLVFASLNISEMDRQLFNPEGGFPMIEVSSEVRHLAPHADKLILV